MDLQDALRELNEIEEAAMREEIGFAEYREGVQGVIVGIEQAIGAEAGL